MSKKKEDKKDTSVSKSDQKVESDTMPEDKYEKERAAKLQVMADFENYRKRMESERSTFGALANLGLIKEMLEIHDDMQMAMNDESLDIESAKQSITNAQEKLRAAARSAGVEPLEVKVGDDFDSSRMEAVTTVPDEKLKNKVVAVISSGFKYASKDGVINAAKVVVGK